MGVVYFETSPDLKLLDILELADEAVYHAKNAGRGRYVIHCLKMSVPEE